jgi:transcriptional regulator with XRE-family HTH domain
LRFRIRPEVRALLARRNVTQNRLARLCGITSGYMSQLLSGERFAGAKIRQRIMDAIPLAAFEELFEEVVQ